MATDITLRSVKGAKLTHAEMDQNWESLAQTVDAISVNYTIAVTDQNKVMECNLVSGTITLPTVVSASGTDTDSFRVTVKNINASTLIVSANGGETIEGNPSINLRENEAATFSLESTALEWNIIGFYPPSLVGVLASANELNQTIGATSNLQGQLDGQQVQINNKQPLDAGLTDISGLPVTDNNFIVGNGASWVAENGAAARASMGVDASGTDNSTNVSLAGTPNYLTIAGQVITRSLISLTTHISGQLAYANMNFNNSIVAADISNNAIGQDELISAAVGQAELKSASGFISDSIAGGNFYVLPGGSYGFLPEMANGNPNQADSGIWGSTTTMVTFGTTQLARILIITSQSGVSAAYAYQRYIQASPPYNLGDGEIGLFAFALVNKNSEVVGSWFAPDAPWHSSGETNTQAKYTRNNIPYRMEKAGNIALLNGEFTKKDIITSPKIRDKFLLLNETVEEFEITQELKQRDMPVIPHPMVGNDLSELTVVLLDPAHDETWKLAELHNSEINLGECLHNGYIKISNSNLNRVSPPGVQTCSFSWK